MDLRGSIGPWATPTGVIEMILLFVIVPHCVCMHVCVYIYMIVNALSLYMCVFVYTHICTYTVFPVIKVFTKAYEKCKNKPAMTYILKRERQVTYKSRIHDRKC